MNPQLEAAYRQARYRLYLPAGVQQIHLEMPQPRLDQRLRRHGCRRHWQLLTACNPRSRRLPAGVNRQRLRRLAAQLRACGWRCLPACSSAPDGHWREPGYLVLDAPLPALKALARRHGQLALVGASLGKAAQLIWL